MNTELNSTIATAKRSCSRCFSQKSFRPNDEDREIALKSTKSAKEILRNAFDEIRKNDAPIEQIRSVKIAKTLCLDAIDACTACNKDRPRIKEILLDIKQ